jgi:hypothetical protein
MAETVRPVTLGDQIRKQLAEKGTLSGADIAQAAQASAPQAAARTAPEETDSGVKLGPDNLDSLTKAGSGPALEEAIGNDMLWATNPDDMFGMADELEKVTITKEDKARFMDAFVDGSRFTRRFSLLNGRLSGMFRSKKMCETRAIIAELTRQAGINKDSMNEHATRIRYALLHFQLAELNGVQRPEVQGPLMAQERIDTEKQEVRTVPPRWTEEMMVCFDGRDEGWKNVLYRELKTFEKVYWEMVRNARDQNFWHPEDSIIE